MSQDASLTAISPGATLGVGGLPIAPTLDWAGAPPIATGAALAQKINTVDGSAGGTVTLPTPVQDLRVGLVDILAGAWTIATAGPETVQNPETGAIGPTAAVTAAMAFRIMVFKFDAFAGWVLESLVTPGTVTPHPPFPPVPDVTRFVTQDLDTTSGGANAYISLGAALFTHVDAPSFDSLVHVRAGAVAQFGLTSELPVNRYAATLDEVFEFTTGSTSTPLRSDTNVNTATSGNEGFFRLEVISGSIFLRVNEGAAGRLGESIRARSTMMVTYLQGTPLA